MAAPVVGKEDRPIHHTEVGAGEEGYVARLFDSFDKKGCGCLDKVELAGLCQALGSKPWTVFKELGVNKSGSVNKDAFLKWWFSTPKQVSATPEKKKFINKEEKEAARKVIATEIKKLKAALLEIEQAFDVLEAE